MVMRGARQMVGAIALLGMCASTVACGSDDANGTGSENTTTTAPAKRSATNADAFGSDDTANSAGGQLVFGIEAEPEGLDPLRFAFSASGNTVASAVFDPLFTTDENGQAVPYLATSVESNDDYTMWTIGLPEGVEFHDGTPLNADALVRVFEAYRTSPITKLGYQIVDAVAAQDATHVVLTLNKPVRSLPALVNSQGGYVFAPAMIDDPSLASTPIGTGPFVFESHEPDVSWTFERNTSYWRTDEDGMQLPYLDAIQFRPVPEPRDRGRQLTSGDLDLMHTADPQTILDLRSLDDLKRVENHNGLKNVLLLNSQTPPFDSLTARRAIAYATNLPKFRKEELLGVSAAANSPFAPGQPGYSETNAFPEYDLAKAKELVLQYEAETRQPLAFTALGIADAAHQSWMQIFGDDWEAAGMDVTVDVLPQFNLIAQVAGGNYQLGQFELFGATNPDADEYYWQSSSILELGQISLNFPRFGDSELDAAIDDALATDDPERRDTDYGTVADILAEQVPYIWIDRSTMMLAANPGVNGIYGSMNGTLGSLSPKTWIGELALAGD